MTTLTIKDVPEALADILRQRAARNHRSLQGELMSILESATAQALPDPNPNPNPNSSPAHDSAALRGHADPSTRAGSVVAMSKHGPIVRQGWKTPEQIFAEQRSLYPMPLHDQASSLALIREDRDSR